MFLKFALKNTSTLVLAACVISTFCDCAVAQISVSSGQIRNLSAIDAQTRQETGKAGRLFIINDEKSLPPVSQFSKARIVSGKDLVPTSAQSHSVTASSAPTAPATAVAPPVARVAMQQPTVAINTSPSKEKTETGYYTISFAQPYKRSQSNAEVTEAAPEKVLDAPMLKPSITDEPKMVEADEDLEDVESGDVGQRNLSGDELELEDDFEDNENDSPIARPEFGRWPSKSIYEVSLDLTEHGATSPEDRSARLFNSSQRLDGNIVATNKLFAWAAPNINYQPLYFEDVALERYGQTKGLVKQPFVSAGRFLADGLFLGTRASRVSPQSCDSPLGYCRPGSPTTVSGGDGCACKCFRCAQEECQSCR